MKKKQPYLEISSNSLTHIGMVRSVNQDSIFCDDQKKLYIVADGMGGHAGGEIASLKAIECISAFLSKNLDQDNKNEDSQINLDVKKIIVSAIEFACYEIYEHALSNPELRGMGTTVSLVQILGDYFYIGHVGDSRCYLNRSGFFYRLTHDHSLVNEQVRAGRLSEKDAESHKLRNIITRSVGYKDREYVDAAVFKLKADDKILICSDGLHGKISEKEIADMVYENDINSIPMLIDKANANGGDDNISAIVVKADNE